MRFSAAAAAALRLEGVTLLSLWLVKLLQEADSNSVVVFPVALDYMHESTIIVL